MKRENRETNNTAAIAIQKKAYARPRLVNYGAVHMRTQAASGGPNENSGGMMAQSDRGIKEHISKIGVHPLGFGLYLFDFKPEYRGICGVGRQFGVMADEVEQVMPEAVSVHPDGYKLVDYGMLGISRRIH